MSKKLVKSNLHRKPLLYSSFWELRMLQFSRHMEVIESFRNMRLFSRAFALATGSTVVGLS